MVYLNNTAFIWAGLAIAGPILIHLLTRRQTKKYLFPAVRFLIEADRGRQAFHRLRTIIVLTLRCLVIAALVLVFAKPVLKHPEADVVAPETQNTAIVIDATFSMQRLIGGVSLLDQAKVKAADILRQLRPGVKAAVVVIKGEPQPLLPIASANIAALYKRLAGLTCSQAFGTPQQALSMAADQLGGQGHIYIFSDFQKTNWKDTKLALPAGMTLHLMPLTKTPVQNIAVTDVKISPAVPVRGEPVEITVSVLNSTDQAIRESVSLTCMETTYKEQVALAPMDTTTVRFSLKAADPGAYDGTVVLERNDELNGDNKRYFAFTVQPRFTVLMITDVNPDDPTQAPFFIKHAIAPFPGKDRAVTIEQRHSQDLDSIVLETSDLFLLYPPVDLSRETSALLVHRILNGIGLLCFIDSLNAIPIVQALTYASEAISTPFVLQGMATSADDAGKGMVQINYDRGPLQIFANPDGKGLPELRFLRYPRSEILPEREDEIIARYTDGSSALALSQAGRGKIIWANLSMGPKESNVAGSALMPALLHECIVYLSRKESSAEGRPGEPWEFFLPPVNNVQSTQMITGDQSLLPVEIINRGDDHHVLVAVPQSAGIYQIMANGQAMAKAVVNIDARESDPDQFLPQTRLSGAAAPDSETAGRDRPETEAATGRRKSLLPWVALGCAFFLLAEMILMAFWRGPERKSGGKNKTRAV